MSQITIDLQSRLLAHLYSGTIEHGRWADMLRILASSYDAVNCSLAAIDMRTESPIVQYTSRSFEPSWHDDYQSRYAKLSPLRPILFKRENIGRAMTADQVMTAQDFENTEFYRDFLKRYDIRHVLGSVFRLEHGCAAYIALHRSSSGAAFDQADIESLQSFLPHLNLAFRIRSHCLGLSRYEEISQQYFDTKGKGLLCLNRRGQIASINKEAERILEMRDGLSVAQGRLQADDPQDNRHLQHLLSYSTRTDISAFTGSPAPATGGTAVIHRRDNLPPYELWIFPIFGRTVHFEDNDITAAVEISDPTRSVCPAPEAVLAGYRLTKAEMRLACALAEGAQLKDIALRFCVSVNTLKVQRRALYRKIGATRHFDLIRLVRRSA